MEWLLPLSILPLSSLLLLLHSNSGIRSFCVIQVHWNGLPEACITTSVLSKLSFSMLVKELLAIDKTFRLGREWKACSDRWDRPEFESSVILSRTFEVWKALGEISLKLIHWLIEIAFKSLKFCRWSFVKMCRLSSFVMTRFSIWKLTPGQARDRRLECIRVFR